MVPTGWAATPSGFLRSTPEAEGIASASIAAFIDAMEAAGHELHSIMVARHGRIVAEGWWHPYAAQRPHSLYSLSKSFTSTAVGFAISEGKLRVDDPVISFFRDDLPTNISSNLAALQLKHLLTMSVGQAKEPTDLLVKYDDWAKVFLAQPIVHTPGTTFLYNSTATYMCSAIVQKVTGQRVVDYLESRLFRPLGISTPTWETCPRGVNTGGWGLSLPTEALARFGQTLLQNGRWEGNPVIPAAWVADATAFHIQQADSTRTDRPHAESDWLQGYGYQFWRCRHGAYRGDGALGQFVIVFPEQDAVVVMTGESADMQGELDLVWKHLLPGMQAASQSGDESALALKRKLNALALPVPRKSDFRSVKNARFQFRPNSLGLAEVEFLWNLNGCRLRFRESQPNRVHEIDVGDGAWIVGRTALPGVPPALSQPVGHPPEPYMRLRRRARGRMRRNS